MKLNSRKDYRQRRHRRVRKRISGTADKPRMAVSASIRNISVQFIDDEEGRTLAAASTTGSDAGANIGAATALGQRAAEVALGRGIRQIVVDRGGHAFHGRVKAAVDAALAAGLSTSSVAGVPEPVVQEEPEAAEAPEAVGEESVKEEK
ncbi:MAG: 50S ribosomal protein L18 [Lentisphaerae bacterium]|nr:50S ribosomal protein L18 [Lentisphaerota bacterium]